MFKKLFSLLLLIVPFGFLQGQITLTADNAYEADLLINYSTTVIAGNIQNVGFAGADVVWDFSQIITDQSASTTFLDVSEVANNQFYPQATLGVDDGSNQAFYSTSPTALSFWGAFTASGAEVIYTDPQDFLRFPFTYENNFTDSFSGTATTNTTLDRMGTTEVTCDGYGTLITPSRTYDEVVRVKTIMDYGDFYGGYELINYTEERYEWYDATEKFPVLAINAFNFGGNTGTVISYIEGTSTSTNTLSELESLSLSPNPATDFVNIQTSNLNASNDLSIEIFNQMGQQVLGDIIDKKSFAVNTTLDVSNLGAGTYFLFIRDGGQLMAKEKLVIIK